MNIKKINMIYTPLNKWLRMMCLKQKRGLPDYCLTPDGYVRDCDKCRYRNNFSYKGQW